VDVAPDVRRSLAVASSLSGRKENSMGTRLTAGRALLVGLLAVLIAAAAAASSSARAPAASTANAASPKPATAAQWARITAAAKREGEVTIYSSQNPLYLADFAKAVEQKYGIKVTINRNIDSVLTQQLTAEYGAGNVKADIFIVATKATVLGAHQPQNRWAVDAVGPALYTNALDRKIYAKPGKAVIVGAALLGAGWNTSQWPSGIKDMTDFLNPRLKGRIGVIIPSAFSIIDWYKWVEENWGRSLITRLAAQEPKLYASSLPMTQAIASGEIAAGTFVAASAEDLKEQGKKSGQWNAPWWAMVLRSAPHPNAAQFVFNFMFTRDGQSLISKRTGSPLKGVPKTHFVKPRTQNLKESTPAKVTEFQGWWDGLFR
jgi:iron(III) transport system substrate-binding protein